MPSKRPPKGRAAKAKPHKAVEQKSSPPTAPLSPFTFKNQLWILWGGLLVGLFYGWYFNKEGSNGASPVNLHTPEEDILLGVISPWDVVDLPGKGKGAIANRDIKQGELLLKERPLFLVPPAVAESPTEFVWNKVQNLTESQRKSFKDLSFVSVARNPNPTQDEKHLLLSIMETNAVAAGSSVGVFPRMARLNHGCSNAFNAVYSWRENEGILVIHALKDIAQGSEILTTYFNTNVPRDQRRAYLQDHYGFHCTCSSCSLPDEESKRSDARLLAMSEHHRQLKPWAEGKISGVDAINHIHAIWELGEEEGYWSERGRLAADAMWIAAGHGDADAVREWGLLSMKWYSFELGVDSSWVSEIKAAVVEPRSHRAWNTQKVMKVGGPGSIR